MNPPPLHTRFSRCVVLSPSGAVLDQERFDRGTAFLSQCADWQVTLDTSVLARHQRFAGSDEERIQALLRLTELNEPCCVIASRGGYGLTRILDDDLLIRLATWLEKTGSVLVGHSDLTALQLGLMARGTSAGHIWHGPMVCYDLGAQTMDPLMWSGFEHCLTGAAMELDWNCHGVHSAGAPSALQGPLWGGNLAMVCSLIGTPWMPHIQGGILVLEDIAEHPYRVERMLLQLAHAGILQQQKALLLGQFTDYRLTELDQGFDMAEVLACVARRIEIPVLDNFPFGHVPQKTCLPFGKQGELSWQGGACRLRFQA